METYKIEILNWEKYQVRKDLKTMNFFRVQTDIFSGHKFLHTTRTGKLVFFYLLTRCARAKASQCQVSTKELTIYCQLRARESQKALESLEQNQIVTIVSRNEYVPRVEKRRVEKTRVDKSGAKTKTTRKAQPKIEIKNLGDVTSALNESTYREWVGMFKDEAWIAQEIKDSLEWCEAKGKTKRTVRDWKIFFKGWLKRAKTPRKQVKTFAQMKEENSNRAMKEFLEEKGYGKESDDELNNFLKGSS